MYDVIVVGGSYAGLSAALQLARARCSVLVIDAGRRRNRFASSTHGLLGYDGKHPDTLASEGRADVMAYPTVTWREVAVNEVQPDAGGFLVYSDSQGEFQGRRLIIATGVVDELPDIAGLEARWGTSVFHCPYCHGYELGKGRLGALATCPISLHSAMLVSEWAAPGQMTFFLNEQLEPEADQLTNLTRRGIQVEREPVELAEGEAPGVDLRLRDGRVTRLDGLFLVPHTVLEHSFAEQLGCELESGPSGQFYKTDAMKATTVPGVFACGDAAAAAGTVATAISDGAVAGLAAHASLVFG